MGKIAPVVPHPATLYDQDFFSWSIRQARLLREGRFAELDIENLAEEIEGLARSEVREAVSRLAVVIGHLLKWQHQPGMRTRSWDTSIEREREAFEDHLDENSGLKNKLPEILVKAYREGRRTASRETGLPLRQFPATCPYTLEEVREDGWRPETSGDEAGVPKQNLS